MFTKEVTERSAVRALERSMVQGGLGRGSLGVVAARSGVGKTACLVQIGLDALLRGLLVMHVSTEAPIGHLRSYYDELFHEIERTTGLQNASAVMIDLERRRLLISQPGTGLRLVKLREAVSVARGALGRDPDLLIVEGFDFESANDLQLQELRELAAELNAEMWLSARTHRSDPIDHPRGYPRPIDRLEKWLDVIIALEPADDRVRLQLLKDHDQPVSAAAPIELDSVSMQLVDSSQEMLPSARGHRERFVLHSGGARGAEAAFGEMAERYGIREITFTFEGHTNRVRTRGLHCLTDADLRLGDVSLRYVSHRLQRSFPEDPAMRRVLQSIWHQIRPCGQVFVVGQIQDGGTVRGGTGWGAELARRWNKDLYVFDQDRDSWFTWADGAWKPIEPVIESPMFAGTGTSHIRPNGLRAVETLFERSFGSQA